MVVGLLGVTSVNAKLATRRLRLSHSLIRFVTVHVPRDFQLIFSRSEAHGKAARVFVSNRDTLTIALC